MKREELFVLLDGWFKYSHIGSSGQFLKCKDYDKCQQAKEQICQLIQKPQVTDGWIEEKARELLEKGIFYPEGKENEAIISLDWAKDFIRSFIEQMPAKKATVSEEFVEKWTKQWMQDDSDFIRRELIKRMAARMLSDHEKRITEHEQRIKKLEEKK